MIPHFSGQYRLLPEWSKTPTFSLVPHIQTSTGVCLEMVTGSSSVCGWPPKTKHDTPYLFTWDTSRHHQAEAAAHFNHEFSARDVVVCIQQLFQHSHESCRYAKMMIGYRMLEGPLESRSKILCTDPGRHEFQVDPPFAQIRQKPKRQRGSLTA